MIVIDPRDIHRHLTVLTRDIGVRLAGSTGERQAGEYIAEHCRRAGWEVSTEAFPVRERAVVSETLDVQIGGVRQRFPCSLLSNAPGTGGAAIDAPIVLHDAHTGYRRPDLSHLRGAAVLHLGSHIETPEHYRRLMAAHPAFLLFVDARYPGTVATSDGMFPAYVHEFGAVPTVSVAYQDAWTWVVQGATHARLAVDGGMRDSTSHNIVAERPGTDPDGGLIFVGAHHDTQADSVGADDNGTGVAALLALADALGPVPLRRTIRLVSFGTEEQLSVGSAVYVRRHRDELARHGRFMFNFDAFGSHLGWTYLVTNGADDLSEPFVRHMAARDVYVSPITDLIPYADHFPFVAAAVPTAWVARNNCTAGRFFHHRPDDDMSRVSCDVVAATVAGAGDAVLELVRRETWPATWRVDEATRQAAAVTWDDLFGGWRGFVPA